MTHPEGDPEAALLQTVFVGGKEKGQSSDWSLECCFFFFLKPCPDTSFVDQGDFSF